MLSVFLKSPRHPVCFPCIQSFGFDYLYLVEPTLTLFYSVFSKYFTNIVEDEGYCFNESLLTHTILANSSLLKENKFPFLNYNFAKSPKKRYFVFWSSTLISKFPIYSKHYQAPPPQCDLNTPSYKLRYYGSAGD